MKFKKSNVDDEKVQLNIYMNKSIQEIQTIIPKWAYGKHVGNLLNSDQHPTNKEYTIFLVETLELIKNTEFYEVNIETIFTGETLNDDRIARILHRWENNKFVDPPDVGLCNFNRNKLELSDGRHRTKICYLLGVRQIPIAVHNSLIKRVSEIINLLPS